MKGDIHSYVFSTNSFLYNIGDPRIRQNNTRYQIIKIVKYEWIQYLKIWYPVLFCLYLSSPNRTEDCLYLKRTYECHLLFEYLLAVYPAMSGSRDMGKTVQGIIFQEYDIHLYLTILIIWYPILFCLYLGFPMSHKKLLVLKT